ncbi:MAG: type VI secretion system needle protein Hcp, partial [Candidatus Symbiothrix sp.]|nr:type VI secretion system needle protein Hcp [Candidatus Symbiothrix sp.]
MSFRANLNFEGKDYDVIKCYYTIEREVDSKGRPSSNLYGGKIHLSVESTTDVSLIDKMATQFKPNTGSITFKKNDEDAKMKELKWENGYIVEFKEGIQIVGEVPMLTEFVISAQK